MRFLPVTKPGYNVYCFTLFLFIIRSNCRKRIHTSRENLVDINKTRIAFLNDRYIIKPWRRQTEPNNSLCYGRTCLHVEVRLWSAMLQRNLHQCFIILAVHTSRNNFNFSQRDSSVTIIHFGASLHITGSVACCWKNQADSPFEPFPNLQIN